MTTFQDSARVSAEHRTDTDGGRGLPLARSGSLQLGARLVRRRAGDECGEQGPPRSGSWMPRRTGKPGSASQRCRAAPTRSPTSSARRRAARRPRAADARQRGPAVGDDAGRDEARRGRDPGHHAAHRATICATGSTRGGEGTSSRRPDQVAKFADLGRRLHAHRRRRPRSAAGCVRRRGERRRPSFRADGPTTRDRSAAALFHLGHDGEAQARAAHATRAIPVGHLSTMYWIGLQPGDVHLNISSPGWAKHAWSCFFAPWNAGATRVRLQPAALRRQGAARHARPLRRDHALRAADGVADADPGGPRGVQAVALARAGRRRRAAQPGGHRPGAGRLGPHHPRRLRPDRDHGADRQLAGPAGQARLDGPAAAGLSRRSARRRRQARRTRARSPAARRRPSGRPDAGLSATTASRPADAMATATTAPATSCMRDADGYITYVGRSDDVFKSSDYRISPFELESVLIEHPAVAEAAVVPSPDPIRLAVPKAFVAAARASSRSPRDRAVASSRTCARASRRSSASAASSSPELPKTISGKIRRVQLRRLERDDDRNDPARSRIPGRGFSGAAENTE